MRAIIENPAPLNATRAFPYKVRPFPVDWLLKFTSLGTIPEAKSSTASTPSTASISNPNLPTSLESWT